MVCVVDTGMPSAAVARNSVIAAAGLGAEAADRLELGDPLSHGLDDAPAAEQRAERDGHVAGDDHPVRHVRPRGREAGRDQQHPDDAHGFLRVVAAVPEAVEATRTGTAAAGTSGPRAPAWRARRSRIRQQQQREPSTKPRSGESTMKITVFTSPLAISAPEPALATAAPTMPPISACDELEGMP